MQRLALLLLLCLSSCTSVAPPQATFVSGPTGVAGAVVDRNGNPAVGAYVDAYRSARGGLRGPADFEATVDGNGRYFLDLIEGRYYLVARMRQGGGDSGPPRVGDAWAIHPRNPIDVVPNRTTQADFRLHGVAQPMLMKEGSLAEGETGFSGTIVDGKGNAVGGAIVLGYRDADFRRMPDFTAPSTGDDGHFTLYVPQEGRYCLAVRTRTRGQPIAGELYGLLGEGESGCRNVKRGEILAVGTITVTPFHK